MVTCQLCNEELGQISYNHLKYVHTLTIDEYRTMFPNTPLQIVSEEQRRSISETLMDHPTSEETKQRMKESQRRRMAEVSSCIDERASAVRTILKKRKYMRRYSTQYYQVPEHKEEKVASMRRWNEEHREEVTEYNRCWNEMHPEKRTEYGRKRRALEAGSDGNFTPEEFKLLCEVFEHRCIYCEQELPLVPDHAIPISRGGSNNIENIVPACVLCNQRKHTMTYDEFVGR